MQLSTSTNIFFNRPQNLKADIFDTIYLCAKAGYKVMDFNFHDMSVFSTPFKDKNWKEWIRNIKDFAEQNEVEFRYGHLHFYDFSLERTKDTEFKDELIKRGIISADILGIKWLVIHACTDFNSSHTVRDSKRATINYLKPMLKLAESYGIGICLENLWEENIAPKRRYTTTAEELVDLVDTLSLEHNNVGICWDFEHSAIMMQDIESELDLVGNRLKMIHVSDYTSIKNDHILPYEGLIDWKHIMEVLVKNNYKGDLNYEIHRYTMNTPDELVLSKLKYSVDVGNYLINVFKKLKGEM